ncbi:MAG: ABC transporter ATP-binding protein [Tannerellaceae bacterium]|jgi:ABC-type multidrug transport system ATPase subunit|nr:ABC transporter ATP-binding protein [Tannerellaceae bacterium]
MITLHHLSKNYGDLQALRDISLEINDGLIFGFIGPDGAGKTTLFRILATLILPDTGQVLINHLHAVKDFRQIRQLIGYMPARFSLYPDLTVEENLRFYASLYHSTASLPELYSHLEPFKHRRADNLSGGMKQKLALCCALIHRPRILLLDEPTTGVDPVSRKEFWNILYHLRQQGITILVSTPYMDEANRCDAIALIQQGTLLIVDSPPNILASCFTSSTLYAAKAANNYRLLADLKENKHVKLCYISGDSLRVVFHQQVPELRDVHLQPVAPTMEDCFIQLMH